MAPRCPEAAAPGVTPQEKAGAATRGPGSGDLARDLARLRALESAAREFCERCERGEIRSERSYRRFRAALAGCAVA